MKSHPLVRQIKKNWPLLTIIGIGLIMRIITAVYLGDEVVVLPGTFDQISYDRLAQRVVDGYGFTFGQTWWPQTEAGAPTAHWSYLYTLFLAFIYKVFGLVPTIARLFQAIIVGILQPYLAYCIGRRAFNEKVGLLAAALTVIYSYFIYYSAALMTEAFYITAILASLYLAIWLTEVEQLRETRKLAIGVGFTLGISVLLRQLFLLFIPLLLMWVIWVRYKRFGRVSYEIVILVIAIIGLMILPFSVYNYTRFNRFVLLNTNAGYAFFWANHPIYGTLFEPILPMEFGRYQDLIPIELRQLDEAELDQALLVRGIQFVVDDPGRYVLLSLSRIPAYFKFWPSAETDLIGNIARVFSFGLLWPFMAYGLFYALIHRKETNLILDPAFLLVLFVFTYTAIHLLSWALIRYRLPVDAVLMIFAGLAIFQLLKRIHIKGIDRWFFQFSES